MIIIGKECEDCKFATIDESDKGRITVYCVARDKTYYWGQCIPCEDKLRIIKEDIS